MNIQLKAVAQTEDGVLVEARSRRGPDKKPRKNPEGLVGFAKLSPEERRELASKGGRSAHVRGTAHEWNHQTSLEANRKRAANMRAKKKVGATC